MCIIVETNEVNYNGQRLLTVTTINDWTMPLLDFTKTY